MSKHEGVEVKYIELKDLDYEPAEGETDQETQHVLERHIDFVMTTMTQTNAANQDDFFKEMKVGALKQDLNPVLLASIMEKVHEAKAHESVHDLPEEVRREMGSEGIAEIEDRAVQISEEHQEEAMKRELEEKGLKGEKVEKPSTMLNYSFIAGIGLSSCLYSAIKATTPSVAFMGLAGALVCFAFHMIQIGAVKKASDTIERINNKLK